ncbi:MAG: hypothetical protein JWL61_4497 [Gemmatimonadetes bacterium]|nr:hypothetical protein [Gemmatimonadota bacterium]
MRCSRDSDGDCTAARRRHYNKIELELNGLNGKLHGHRVIGRFDCSDNLPNESKSSNAVIPLIP